MAPTRARQGDAAHEPRRPLCLAALARGRAGGAGRVLPASSDDPNEDIDAALDELLAATDWSGSFELMYGLAGIGVYALERLPRASGRRALARVVVLLDRLALRDGDGVAWRAPDD